MQEPAYIKPGDKIGIVSPASKIEQQFVEPAIELLKSLGYQVELGKHIFAQAHQFAGTDEQRSADIQAMLDNPDIKAIICSRGGYGTLRTLQKVSWKKFCKSPKWIVGFSDITVLHSKLNRLKVSSIHGVMPRYFIENNQSSKSFDSLLKALAGEKLSYKTEPSDSNRKGKSTGELVGGNLSILYSLRSTPYDIDTRRKILFIEDLSEYLYHLDRMMMNLKAGGKLAQLTGLVVGGFTGMKDNDTPFGKNATEIIFDAVAEYDYPVLFNFPAGHQSNNFALKLGCTAELEVTPTNGTLKQ